MTTLDLTTLRTVVAVASFGSVRRAADALRLSQPAVSGHLRRLERDVGFPVVTRQGRSIAFTARGEDLLNEARHLLDEHDAALARLRGDDYAELVVVSTEHATEPMLAAVSAILATHHPGREIQLRFHRTERIREYVHAHRADVALGLGTLGPGTQTVTELALSWVGPTDRPPDATRLIAFTAPCLVRERILGSPVARGRDLVRECVDLTGLLAAVRELGGVTLLPRTDRPDAGVRWLDEWESPGRVPLTMTVAPRVGATSRRDLAAALGQLGAGA